MHLNGFWCKVFTLFNSKAPNWNDTQIVAEQWFQQRTRGSDIKMQNVPHILRQAGEEAVEHPVIGEMGCAEGRVLDNNSELPTSPDLCVQFCWGWAIQQGTKKCAVQKKCPRYRPR